MKFRDTKSWKAFGRLGLFSGRGNDGCLSVVSHTETTLPAQRASMGMGRIRTVYSGNGIVGNDEAHWDFAHMNRMTACASSSDRFKTAGQNSHLCKAKLSHSYPGSAFQPRMRGHRSVIASMCETCVFAVPTTIVISTRGRALDRRSRYRQQLMSRCWREPLRWPIQRQGQDREMSEGKGGLEVVIRE